MGVAPFSRTTSLPSGGHFDDQTGVLEVEATNDEVLDGEKNSE